jgi:hypothetical protein
MYGVHACGVFQALSTSVVEKTGEIEGSNHNIYNSITLLMRMHDYCVQNNST